MTEHEHTGKLLEELEDKSRIARTELEENQTAYEHTKVEYERLEKELEELSQKLDVLREDSQQNAL